MFNRVWLALTGLVLLGCGAATLAAGLGGPRRPIVTGGLSRWVAMHPWFWPAVTAGSLTVAMLGGTWLAAQWRCRSLRRLAMGDARAGATRMAARVATRAIAADVTSYPGVSRVRTRLSGSRRRPSMRVRVLCEAGADLDELVWRIRDDAMVRLRTTLGRADLGGVIDFRVQRDAPEKERRVV
jgi:hypothetical protein